MICLSMLLGALASAGQPDAGVMSGAADLFTSDEPVMVRVRQLVADGRLGEAEGILQAEQKADDPRRSRAAADGLEIIRRIRRDYRQELPALVERLRKSIPDVTAADVERWRAAGEVQYRVFDGRPWYFIREPSNIFRFCEEAKRRRDTHAATQPAAAPDKQAQAEQQMIEHIRKVLAAADASGRTEVLPIRQRIRYKLTVAANRPGAKAGSLVRCWLPFPQEYRQQKQVRLIRTAPAEYKLAPNAAGDRVLSGAAQRTLYLEQQITDPAQPVVFEEEFEYVCYAFCPKLDDAAARPLPADWGKACLEERPPHIVFTPELREAVKQAVGNETNPLAKARKIFHYIDAKLKYCAEEEYSTIPSCTRKGLATWRGDCGIHAMLFIAMCRAAGIPARWQSGWETQPLEWNMHDWAEFYVEPWGWLPADPSYGLKKSDDPRIRDFFFGHMDSYRMIVNLDYGWQLDPPKQSLRSEPADFQRGEVEIDGRNLYYDEWDWDFSFDLKPVGD